MTSSLEISERFCGPPTTANGGYSIGLLAERLLRSAPSANRAIDAKLRKPPPLNKVLQVNMNDDMAELSDQEEVLIVAKTTDENAIRPVKPPSYNEAIELSKNYIGFKHHVFPTCFVCGPNRSPDDALCIYCGGKADDEIVAGPWLPAKDLSGNSADGKEPSSNKVLPRYITAALDCPGAFAIPETQKLPYVVLARMTLWMHGSVDTLEKCVLVGWPIQIKSRNYVVGTGLFNPDGDCVAIARSLWMGSSSW